MAAVLRVLAAVVALIAGIGVAVLVGAGPAAAHTSLISSDPAADSALSAGPGTVSATFNEDLQSTFAAMTVVGPDGNLWSAGDAQVHGPTVSIPLRPLGPSGKYTVNYRVTSADGHVVSGSWSFTVTAPSTGAPGPAAAASGSRDRIPLWPFAVGAVALVAAAAAWAVRRQS